MTDDLPSPDQILEELADKVALQIDRLAPVAFDGALREMKRYHRFLLALNASRTPDGTPFSYAEVAGAQWRAPHLEWIRQYRRLFERAADRIPDDDHFIHSLAYTATSLLPGPDGPALPPGIVQGIVDLGPVLMHRLEAWVTKRTTVETGSGEAAVPRLLLAGSDAKAFANALTGVVGAWESLLQHCPYLYGWRERDDAPDEQCWSALAASWPFLRKHMQNTAYCLAVAVWNEDEIGADLFRDSLVRWPTTLDYRLDNQAELRHRRLLFPDILKLDWAGATARAAPLLYDYMPSPTPHQLFNNILRSTHDDTVLLTAALLLFWTISAKQVSDIGGRMASALLRRKSTDEDEHPWEGGRELTLRPMLLDFLRLELAGERHRDGTYGADLDHIVSALDNMTERRVVPGRVYTPSTLHGRDELLVAIVAILTATTRDESDAKLRECGAELARNESLLPEGDGSLRSILNELQRYGTTLEQSSPQVRRGFEILRPGADLVQAIEGLRATVNEIAADIRAVRLERLKARPIDAAKIEQLRAAMEVAILTTPATIPFFRHVPVEEGTSEGEGVISDVTVSGIAKAQLVDPPMESPGSNFEEFLVGTVKRGAGDHIWGAFRSRARQIVEVAAAVEEEAFWREVAKLAREVGPDPLLVVSRQAEGRSFRRFFHGGAENATSLQVGRKPQEDRGQFYIATVEGIDVYSADFPQGTAWLFSGCALRAIRYSALDEEGRYLALSFETGDDLKGTMRARFRQEAIWADVPVFELRLPAPLEVTGH